MLFLITVSNFITRLYQVLCSQQIYIDGDEPSFLMFDSGSEIAGDMYHYISFVTDQLGGIVSLIRRI